MALGVSLAACIEESQHAAEKATRELIKVMQRYELTPGGAEGERQRLYAEVAETAAAAKTKAGELIEQAIAAKDAAEIKAAETRAQDTEYMNRLQIKLKMIGGIDLEEIEIDNNTLKALFAEFANDPLAIALIRKAIPGGRSVWIEPGNDRGTVQKHLRDVKAAVFRAIDKGSAYISPADLESGVIPWKSEVDALRNYLALQNESFSKNDAEIWAAVVAKTPKFEADAMIWQMRFHN